MLQDQQCRQAWQHQYAIHSTAELQVTLAFFFSHLTTTERLETAARL
jgi:hypothetical protein